jgi:hypothetical protein
MKTLKKIILFTALLAVPFTSCNDDELKFREDTTVAEDKQAIDVNLDGVINMLENIDNGHALKSIQLIYQIMTSLNIGLKTTEPTEWNEIMWNKLGLLINGDDILNDIKYDHKFYFNNLLGKYTYNISTQAWTKTTNTAMVFEFPSSESVTGNDLILTIQSYTDVPTASLKTRVESGDYWMPTAFTLNLKKDDVKIIECTLINAAYDMLMGRYPTTIDASGYVMPTTFDLDYMASKPNNYKYDLGLVAKDNAHELGANITLYSESEIFNKLTLTGGFKTRTINPYAFRESLTASVWLDDLKVNITIDMDKLFSALLSGSTPNLANINASFTADVLEEELKIATLEVKNIDGDIVICIVYKDGTYETVKALLEDFMAELTPYISVG